MFSSKAFLGMSYSVYLLKKNANFQQKTKNAKVKNVSVKLFLHMFKDEAVVVLDSTHLESTQCLFSASARAGDSRPHKRVWRQGKELESFVQRSKRDSSVT